MAIFTVSLLATLLTAVASFGILSSSEPPSSPHPGSPPPSSATSAAQQGMIRHGPALPNGQSIADFPAFTWDLDSTGTGTDQMSYPPARELVENSELAGFDAPVSRTAIALILPADFARVTFAAHASGGSEATGVTNVLIAADNGRSARIAISRNGDWQTATIDAQGARIIAFTVDSAPPDPPKVFVTGSAAVG